MNSSEAASGAHEENVARFRVIAHAVLEWNGGSERELSTFLLSKGNALGLPPQTVKAVLDEVEKGYTRKLSRPSGQGRVGFDPTNVIAVVSHAIEVATGEAGPSKAHFYPSRDLTAELRKLSAQEASYLHEALHLMAEAFQNR